ncbi:MAG TPA: hypothetical protein VGL98_08625 [Gammaproteobacteria bacterium]
MSVRTWNTLVAAPREKSEVPMVTRVERLRLKMLGGVVVLAIVPSTGSPQPAGIPTDDKQRIAEEIKAAQEQGGPQSAELIQPLTELAEIYEAEGERAYAAAALEEARHVVRVNYGLYTLEQVPLIEQALENQQALGQVATVQALEEELYDLASRHPDDLRTVAIHRGIAERRMNLLQRFIAEEAPAEIYGTSGLFSIERDEVITDLVSEAQIHYADAAAVLLRNGLLSSDELRDLEMQLVNTSELFREENRQDLRRSAAVTATARTGGASAGPAVEYNDLGAFREYGVGADERCHDARGALGNLNNQDAAAIVGGACVLASEELQGRTNLLWDLADTEVPQEANERRERVNDLRTRYALGRESYRRLIAYAEHSPDDSEAWGKQLQAYLELADWDLLYARNGAALAEYALVHENLKTNGVAEAVIAGVFAPEVPIVLPTFRPNPLQTAIGNRYIDVTFEITKFGEPRRIEIVGVAPNVPDAAKDELVDVINTSRFRPRIADGELGRATPVAVRYYLND